MNSLTRGLSYKTTNLKLGCDQVHQTSVPKESLNKIFPDVENIKDSYSASFLEDSKQKVSLDGSKIDKYNDFDSKGFAPIKQEAGERPSTPTRIYMKIIDKLFDQSETTTPTALSGSKNQLPLSRKNSQPTPISNAVDFEQNNLNSSDMKHRASAKVLNKNLSSKVLAEPRTSDSTKSITQNSKILIWLYN